MYRTKWVLTRFAASTKFVVGSSHVRVCVCVCVCVCGKWRQLYDHCYSFIWVAQSLAVMRSAASSKILLVAVCCSMLQGFVVCCSVLQCLEKSLARMRSAVLDNLTSVNFLLKRTSIYFPSSQEWICCSNVLSKKLIVLFIFENKIDSTFSFLKCLHFRLLQFP